MAKAQPVAPASQKLEIDVAPSPDKPAATALATQARALVVVDRDSHAQALEFIRGAKQLKRKIEDHWSRITRSVDELKRNLLNLKNADVLPVDVAIATASDIALKYENAEKQRIQFETQRQRQIDEAKAQQERDRETARLEKQALAAEAASPNLSERELFFVNAHLAGLDETTAAQKAGYKNPAEVGPRLLATSKIIAAIRAKREAAALREQLVAKQEAPLDVVETRVESQLGKAAGVSTRTTYSCNPNVDIVIFRQGVINGRIPWDALEPDLVYLNKQAVALKDKFEQAFPGCKVVKKQGIAG